MTRRNKNQPPKQSPVPTSSVPEGESLTTIVLKRLFAPRIWIYPLFILAVAIFILPRLEKGREEERASRTPTPRTEFIPLPEEEVFPVANEVVTFTLRKTDGEGDERRDGEMEGPETVIRHFFDKIRQEFPSDVVAQRSEGTDRILLRLTPERCRQFLDSFSSSELLAGEPSLSDRLRVWMAEPTEGESSPVPSSPSAGPSIGPAPLPKDRPILLEIQAVWEE